MESNNFKLFEIVNETIQDIYDFLIRYVRTFWLVLFRPKKFIGYLAATNDYTRIVRPFNFVLFSLILLMLGIEILNEPYYEILLLEQSKNEGGARSSFVTDLVKLNTTSLIMKFLPSIVFLILLSKLIEKILVKIFKKESEFGFIYLFAIGVSCATFALISAITFGIYYIDKQRETDFLYNNDIIFFFFFLGLSFLQIIYPAFLTARVLKFNSVHLFKRFLSFSALSILNIVVITIYLGIIISLTPTDEYYQEFQVLGTEATSNGVVLTALYDGNEKYFFKQNDPGYLYTTDYWESDDAFYFNSEIKVVTGKEQNSFVQLEGDRLLEIQLTFPDSLDAEVFDSLRYSAFRDFDLEFYLYDGVDDFKRAKINF